jgi:hypothetical protein
VIDTLNRGINKALTSPDVVERLTKLGMDPATSTPDEFAKIVASDYAKWGRSSKRRASRRLSRRFERRAATAKTRRVRHTVERSAYTAFAAGPLMFR